MGVVQILHSRLRGVDGEFTFCFVGESIHCFKSKKQLPLFAITIAVANNLQVDFAR